MVGQTLAVGRSISQSLWRSLRPTRASTLTEHFETLLHEQTQRGWTPAAESVTTDPKTMQTQLFREQGQRSRNATNKQPTCSGLDMMSIGKTLKPTKRPRRPKINKEQKSPENWPKPALSRPRKKKGCVL
ncbi:hypothetical protein DPEC_G00259650 [Dallia pectoralis]|uniref:Uncharacterized protein n=1 Tax=Dallia pectoralis TaxID=75939 RepID=A0ACC2FRH1_DALPE|nr:hypothetical protein DPEC_G00259650 [Dallia pectoralis]